MSRPLAPLRQLAIQLGLATLALATLLLFVSSSVGSAQDAFLVEAREQHTATLLGDGTVLLAGGFGGDFEIVASADLFDAARGSVRSTSDMQTPRAFHTATPLPDGTVFIAGGSFDRDSAVAGATTEIYDPVTGTFAPGPDLSGPRYEHTATLLDDGTILLAAGGGSGGLPREWDSAEIVDPATSASVAASRDMGMAPYYNR